MKHLRAFELGFKCFIIDSFKKCLADKTSFLKIGFIFAIFSWN